MKYKLGDITSCGGFVTAEKFLLNQNLREIERRLGYQAGRLRQGAYFLKFLTMPTLQDLSFEPYGYSNVAGHHFNFPAELNKNRIKENIINYWAGNGIQLIKVIPLIDHNASIDNDDQYPPGLGVPQWKFTRAYTARVIAFFTHEDYSKSVTFKKNNN